MNNTIRKQILYNICFFYFELIHFLQHFLSLFNARFRIIVDDNITSRSLKSILCTEKVILFSMKLNYLL